MYPAEVGCPGGNRVLCPVRPCGEGGGLGEPSPPPGAAAPSPPAELEPPPSVLKGI